MKTNIRLTKDEFLARARVVHGNEYDYTRSQYSKSSEKITIRCRKHGPFSQIANDHLGGSGCPACARLAHVKWTKEEDQFLHAHYKGHGSQYCAKALNKTASCVRSRTAYLGIRINAERWLHYQDIPGRYWSVLLGNAKARGFAVTIDQAHIWDLYERQKRRCALTGWPVVFCRKGEITASVDRIDSSKGYIHGNVQIVHKLVNRAKVNSNELDFYAMCKAVHEHRTNSFERVEVTEEMDILNDTLRHTTRHVLGCPDPASDFTEEAVFGVLDRTAVSPPLLHPI